MTTTKYKCGHETRGSPMERWRIRVEQLENTISQLITITEKANAISEYAAKQQNTDMVETAVQLGTATDNLSKSFKQQINLEGRQ